MNAARTAPNAAEPATSPLASGESTLPAANPPAFDPPIEAAVPVGMNELPLVIQLFQRCRQIQLGILSCSNWRQ
jgi:hypothetical protein